MRQNPHVRICGGPGSATTLVYPTFTWCGVGSADEAPAPISRHVPAIVWMSRISPLPLTIPIRSRHPDTLSG